MMTVSSGDFNSYLMPRQVIRREKRAATELYKKTTGLSSQRVFWDSHWFLRAASYWGNAILIAASRSQALPTLNALTRTNTAAAVQNCRLLPPLKITIKK